MRLIEERDIGRINACIKDESEDASVNLDSYFSNAESEFDMMVIDYESLPEFEDATIKIGKNIDKDLLKSLAITSLKARMKLEGEREAKHESNGEVTEVVTEEQIDLPEFVYVF